MQLKEFLKGSIMKTVNKPWGKEIWISYSPQFPYVMKHIFTNEGHRSSLHVHNRKVETNYVIGGKGIVYYGTNEENLTKKEIKAGDSFSIFPGEIHRVVAIEDLETIEVSTIEVDDVIRLKDETGRGNGRIESEHV